MTPTKNIKNEENNPMGNSPQQRMNDNTSSHPNPENFFPSINLSNPNDLMNLHSNNINNDMPSMIPKISSQNNSMNPFNLTQNNQGNNISQTMNPQNLRLPIDHSAKPAIIQIQQPRI